MLIADTFDITGRGLVVATDQITSLPFGQKLLATITRPDGNTVQTVAYKQQFLRRNSEPPKNEAFLLIGLSKIDVPIGSGLQMEVPES